MGLLDLTPYSPVSVPTGTGNTLQNQIDTSATKSLQGVDAASQQYNQGVKDQSNLMGPSSDDDPQSAALSQRGQQLYGSAVNSMMRSVAPAAASHQSQLQSQNIDSRAAQFSNMQSALQMGYQQTAFQRQSQISLELSRRNLLSNLFGGVAGIGGMAAAAISNASNPAAVEVDGMKLNQGQATAYATGADIEDLDYV